MFEADAELCAARITASAVLLRRRRRRFESAAAVAFYVAAERVLEAVDAQLEHAVSEHATQRRGPHDQRNERNLLHFFCCFFWRFDTFGEEGERRKFQGRDLVFEATKS